MVELAVEDTTSASPLLLLAQDIEVNGSVRPGRIADPASSQVVRLLEEGDWRGLLSMSAERAIASPDLAEAPLGGRSEVTTVGDYYGLVSENFTVKQVTAIALQREGARLETLQAAIDRAELNDHYSLTQHLVAFGADDGLQRSVRRFVPGVPVMQAALDSDPGARVNLVSRVASFLGFINATEGGSAEGVRKELKAKEVGRWLRAVGDPDPLASFDAWWSLVSEVPPVRRRDAHLDNWVLAKDGRLHALDLEAVGSRPIGYELAQVTDDAPIFSDTDWRDRSIVFNAYLERLPQDDAAREKIWTAYQAGVAARALRRLTWDQESTAGQSHAQGTLEWLAQGADSFALRSWTSRVLMTWRRTRGLSDGGGDGLLIDSHRRRRVSKSMAYHLRHANAVDLDDGGWASIDELTLAMGGKVSASEISIVASTLSDPRFEYRDGLVRARYGHSREVPDAARSEGVLTPGTRAYHATSLSAAKAVIEQRQGILPMTRLLVHLSRSATDALRSGSRHGYPILLSTDSLRLTDLAARGGNTLVASRVEVSALSVESLSTHWKVLPYVQFADRRLASASLFGEMEASLGGRTRPRRTVDSIPPSGGG